jgi:hypothetical protein
MWDTIRRSEVVRFCMYMVCTCYVHAEFWSQEHPEICNSCLQKEFNYVDSPCF